MGNLSLGSLREAVVGVIILAHFEAVLKLVPGFERVLALIEEESRIGDRAAADHEDRPQTAAEYRLSDQASYSDRVSTYRHQKSAIRQTRRLGERGRSAPDPSLGSSPKENW